MKFFFLNVCYKQILSKFTMEDTNANTKPIRVFKDWLDGIRQIKAILGEKYNEFIDDFIDFQKKNFCSYAILGKYLITQITHVYYADEYLNYMDRKNIKKFYCEFDTSKYIK